MFFCFFFFKQKTAYEMRISDWSSDVCSSDLLYGFRHQGRRGDHADLRAQGRKADDVGACHATMQHIAAYRDYQSLDRPLAPSDGERVEQCLCRMFVRSEEHTSELQSLMRISYAVFCLKKKNNSTTTLQT